jgi:glucose-1-phosphate thymidylyltransferase
MQLKYPGLQAHYVTQEDPRGQSHAISLARDFLGGPMLMVFADTLIETDLAFLAHETADAVAWVKPVEDPRRFGVALVGGDGFVQRLIEKPSDMSNNLAVVGFYYFRDSLALLQAIDEQMQRGVSLKGEYYLADAVNIMLEKGLKMRVQKVDIWLDAGTPETLLETNRHLLEHGRGNAAATSQCPDVVIVPPVFVHPSAQVSHSVLGPHVSIGADCTVKHSILQNSILEDGANVQDIVLTDSLIGRKADIQRRPAVVNAGDHTVLTL